jgi:hypothetical protein
MNLDEQWDTLWADVQSGKPWVLATAGALALILTALLLIAVLRALRGKNLNAKASIGFGVVQAGLAFITITGVYEFFHRLLDMPWVEAALLAVIIEGCMWAAVGMIYTYGKDRDEDGKLRTGFGPAGPFFWITIVGGGLLAILGSETSPVAVGRIVVVVLGAYMWYLRLLQVTRRSTTPSKWRWTPRAFLLAIGAIVPGDEDVKNEAREWQVRKLARAIRWANSRQPWRWLGERAIMRGVEQASEDVIAEARRKYAVLYVTRKQVKPTTPVMAALIESVEREALGDDVPPAAAVETTETTIESAPAHRPDLPVQTNGHHPDLSAILPAVTVDCLPGQTDSRARGQVNGHLTAAEQTDRSDLSSTVGLPSPAEPGLSSAGAAAWSQHGDNLVAELRETGKLSRYRVERVCGLHAGQASKVRELAHERAGVPLPA